MNNNLFDNLNDFLITELNKLNIKFNNEIITKLIYFTYLLHKWNKTYNLTSITDPKDMIIKHIIDSVIGYKYYNGNNILDVGTGPGLPGIPLAIIFNDKKFYLLDSRLKRINFIKHAIRELKLSNVIPILSRCEEYNPSINIDCITSRAFASLKDMILLTKHITKNNNCYYLALKGDIKADEILDIPDDFKIIDNIKLNTPLNLGNRCLIKITKV